MTMTRHEGDGDACLKMVDRYAIVNVMIMTVVLITSSLTMLGAVDAAKLGDKLKAKRARLVSATKSVSVAELELTEGKNREVRRMFESQGAVVKRLQRVQIGKIKLGELKPGKWRTLTEPEIKSLLG